MEKHGVTFKDYALANANLAAGMPTAKVCEVLGIEEPLWAEAQEFWANNMAAMSMEDMQFYGEVFTNPKQGKFANVAGAAAGPQEVLKKYPEWDDFLKIMNHIEIASQNGIDVDLQEEYGLSMTEYSQLAMHWSNYHKTKVVDVSVAYAQGKADADDLEEMDRVNNLFKELTEKWQNYFEEKYKNAGSGIAGDIEF